MLVSIVTIFTTVDCHGSFSYYFHLAKGQISIWNRLTDLDKAQFEPGEIVYINELKKALKFARESGLDVGKSYQRFSRMDQDAVSYIVVHAPEFSTQAILFDFPIIGKVPYKGFFKKEMADNLAKKLKSQNFDVYEGRVKAYSMLGIMDDPLVSPMLSGSVVDFIDTIFHELVHKTIWLKNYASFNENLANYIAAKISRNYFKAGQLREFEQIISNEIEYGKKLKVFKSELEKLYSLNLNKELILKKKKESL